MPSGTENVSESILPEDPLQTVILANVSNSLTSADSPLLADAFELADTTSAIASLLAVLGRNVSDSLTVGDAEANAYSTTIVDASEVTGEMVGALVVDSLETANFSAPVLVALSQTLSETAQVVSALRPAISLELSDSMTLAAPDFVALAPQLSEQITAAGQLVNDLQLFAEITEQPEVLDTFAKTLTLITNLQEAIDFSDPLSLVDALQLIDTLQATGQAETAYTAAVALLSAMQGSDSAVAATSLTATDSLQASDSNLATVVRLASFLEAITVTDNYQNVLVLVAQDSITAADSRELTATLLAEILDETDVYTLFRSPSQIAQGVAMNLEGAQPLSEYDNFIYNSLVQYAGKFYGAADSGLYELSGDDDDGTPITARLQSLMLDFGTSRQKRVRSAYLGYTSTGELVLRVKSVSQGQLTEDWYKARNTDAADAPQGNMMHVGQGLKSRYWQFELTNVNGADFEIDLLEMYPIFLGRRV
jgi:hypothetical protein